MTRLLAAAVLAVPLLGCASAPPAGTVHEDSVDGYLEWRDGSYLVVDGQRVATTSSTRFKGQGEAKDLGSIPPGYEVKAKGTRQPDGAIHAREIEAKPNGQAFFEGEIKRATDEAEEQYRKAGRFFEEGENGKLENIGTLLESGPYWERARRIMDQLTPPYLDPNKVRVYAIENKEWNAFAMGNYAVFVFSGLLDDMDDDEVALVLGHELVHATHEHTRRHFKKAMWIQLAALGLTVATDQIDNETYRVIAQMVAQLGAIAWHSGYGRDLEDQSDRVGLRYAYEAGYDINKGPRLWDRFAKKYGQEARVVNFFFSDHSLARLRAEHLQREIALNYSGGPKVGVPVRYADRPPSPSPAVSAKVPSQAPGQARTGTGLSGSKEQVERRDIRVGMTQEEVREALGTPREEVVFGNRIKWTYPDVSVIFENGRVAEVRF